MKHIKSINEMFDTDDEIEYAYSEFINWDLIKDAKDASLEYLDDGLTLIIFIYDNDQTSAREGWWSSPAPIYKLYFSHENINKSWKRWDEDDYIYFDGSKANIEYKIFLSEGNFRPFLFKSMELIERLSEAYPNEKIKF